jgi:hypothetical protein
MHYVFFFLNYVIFPLTLELNDDSFSLFLVGLFLKCSSNLTIACKSLGLLKKLRFIFLHYYASPPHQLFFLWSMVVPFPFFNDL